jgi:ATP-dependent Lhr-like helicase
MEHPLVRQTIDDCLTEATDVAGLIEVLRGLRDGSIERVAVDTPEPSAFARGVLSSGPYTFLDDAPLEERRTQAVLSRRALDDRSRDDLGALDPAAIQRVRDEAWPQPESAEDVHDALLWMGFVTDAEATDWLDWLIALAGQDRVIHNEGRWFAVDGLQDPKRVLLGRLEAIGPLHDGDPRIACLLPLPLGEGASSSNVAVLLAELEHDGAILRTRIDGRAAWCERRLLARIHRYTLERLRSEIQPVTASEFLQFLACWQHVDEEFRLEGPRGVAKILQQLAGFEIPARAWDIHVLPSRVRDYRREWLDELTLSGEFAWGRLWGAGGSAVRVTPVSFVPREELDEWLSLAQPPPADGLSGPADDVLHALLAGGAMFGQSLAKAADLPPAFVDRALAELVAHGLVTCDSFASLRQLITPPSRRRRPPRSVGRWSGFRPMVPLLAGSSASPNATAARGSPDPAQTRTEGFTDATGVFRSKERHGRETMPQHGTMPQRDDGSANADELIARLLLRRTGVVFRRTLLREKLPVRWASLIRIYRRMELRGEVRGGRFVAGFSGEQFALPEAVELLRRLRRGGPRKPISVVSADPLNFQGILTPEPRVPRTSSEQVMVG